MLRVTFNREPIPPRVMEEDEFIREIEAFRANGFADAPAGPVTVECLDAEGRVCWHAYYASVPRLGRLADELTRERAAGGSTRSCP